jgi:hypothetical protein
MQVVKKVDTVSYRDKDGEIAFRQVETEVAVHPIDTTVVKIGGKPIKLQIGPTPGDAFAVYADNPDFHDEDPTTWFKAARLALGMWAAKGNHTVSQIINEHGRSFNMKMIYA